MSTAQRAINTSHTDKQWHILFLNTRVLKLKLGAVVLRRPAGSGKSQARARENEEEWNREVESFHIAYRKYLPYFKMADQLDIDSKLSCSLEYASVACNRTPQSVSWGQNGQVAFGASHSVALYLPKVSKCCLHDTGEHSLNLIIH